MPIHLYQSKKVKRYIGDKEYTDTPWSENQIDPVTIWYADVFFINRERYIALVNPLTKFTFFVFKYSKKTHPDFLTAFKERLGDSLKSIDINPSKYLLQCDMLLPLVETNRSASAHLSRIKSEYEYMIKNRYHGVYSPEDELFYNNLVANEITTYYSKDYDFPKNRFLNELLLRRWI